MPKMTNATIISRHPDPDVLFEARGIGVMEPVRVAGALLIERLGGGAVCVLILSRICSFGETLRVGIDRGGLAVLLPVSLILETTCALLAATDGA